MPLSAETFREIVSGRRRGLIAAAARGIFAAAEPIYGMIVSRKNRRHDSGAAIATRVAAPVISVGNLTVGGTGKTPLVVWLAKWFREREQPVVLISRGYGKREGPNDEALEVAANLPGVLQIQNPNRVAAANKALSSFRDKRPPVLILDDAFQHRRIARDLDIVLIDALEPFGYGRLLPRGLLREPVTSLRRAHVVALSRADAVSAERREEIRRQVAEVSPQAEWLELAHEPSGLRDCQGNVEPLSSWQGKRLAAFAGIGNPAGFRHTLAAYGLEPTDFLELADHQPYSHLIIEFLTGWLEKMRPLDAVICTHKDLVKIPQSAIAGIPLRALQIALAIHSGQHLLEARLQSLLPARE